MDVDVDNCKNLLSTRESGMLLTMDVPAASAGRELKLQAELQAEVFEIGDDDGEDDDDGDGKFNTTGTLSVATVMVFCKVPDKKQPRWKGFFSCSTDDD